MSESKTNDPMIAALLRERAGYQSRGLDDRVAQVDEQLKARGYTAVKDDKPEGGPDDGDEGAEQPKERRTPPRRTTKS